MIPIRDARILVVDDEQASTATLTRLLSGWGFRDVVATNDSSKVVALCAEAEPDAILLDLHMPPPDGFELMAALRPWTLSVTPPAILALTGDMTAETTRRALAAGARDFLTKPFDHEVVRLRLGNLLQTRALQRDMRRHGELLESQVRSRTRQLDEARLEIHERLAVAAEYRDDETGQHTKRVGRTARRLAERLALPARDVRLIALAAPLHDIGKIGIPDRLLLKPGPLDDDERELIKTHVRLGAEVLGGGRSPVLRMAEEIALYHHERWDGGGYLAGLSGESTPRSARIVAVADVFDVLTHDRPYKQAWPLERAVEEISAQRGSQFDPDVVDVFMQLDHEALLRPVEQPDLATPADLREESGSSPAVVRNGHSDGPVPPQGGGTAEEVRLRAVTPSAAESEFMTVSEAATALTVSGSTLRRWGDSGRIASRRTPGGHRRFPVSEIRRLNAAGVGAPWMQPAGPPTRPLPSVGRLLAPHGEEVALQSARSLFDSDTGWFASEAATPELESWLKALAASCLNGDYRVALQSTSRFMRQADLGGASLLERHSFLERFGELMARRFARGGETNGADGVDFRRLFAALRQSLLEEAGRERASSGEQLKLLSA